MNSPSTKQPDMMDVIKVIHQKPPTVNILGFIRLSPLAIWWAGEIEPNMRMKLHFLRLKSEMVVQ